jgi:cell division septation protein DedD
VKQKQHLYIYDRREILVFILLVLMIALFTFTLGIHLGKRIGTRIAGMGIDDIRSIQTLADPVPNRQELTEQAKGANEALEETLNHELREEVNHMGIKLKTPRQVVLPAHPKTANAGATTLNAGKLKTVSAKIPHSPETARYTLQIGSFPTIEEAATYLNKFSESKTKTFLKATEIKGKGKWYRVYIGKFESKTAAEQAGETYKKDHVITSFIVSKLSD